VWGCCYTPTLAWTSVLAWGLGGGAVPAEHRVGRGGAHVQPTSAARQSSLVVLC